MTVLMPYLRAFAAGGLLCLIGQVLIDYTRLTPARILTSYVVMGVILGALGLYEPFAEWAGAGAAVPLTGFGNVIAKGMREAVREKGLLGIFSGGFAAACYMRGIDFYNIPTTILSQVDSSIGGKTAVNLGGVKNIVGAFWQPKKVLIDPDTLDTLSERQKSSGLAEAVKAGLIADPVLFAMFEDYAAGGAPLDLEKVIAASLMVKKKVVEEDERESGVRKILNFGHTIGHGIESVTGLLHGECVAMGMIPMCSPAVRSRLVPVLGALHLPARVHADPEEVYKAVLHDKKMGDGFVSIVSVDTVGSYTIQKVDPAVLRYGIEVVVRL